MNDSKGKVRGAVLSQLVKIGVTVLVCAAIVGSAFFIFNSKANEVEEEKISDTYITERLREVSELSTYAYEYTNSKEITNTREIFGIKLPFTTNRVNIIYKGVIKAGYSLDDVEAKVDNSAKTITVKLPEVEVFDNYILHDETKIEEENNLLNPVHVESATKYFSDITSKELERAKAGGLYQKAETKAKKVITNLFSEFPEYNVSFA